MCDIQDQVDDSTIGWRWCCAPLLMMTAGNGFGDRDV